MDTFAFFAFFVLSFLDEAGPYISVFVCVLGGGSQISCWFEVSNSRHKCFVLSRDMAWLFMQGLVTACATTTKHSSHEQMTCIIGNLIYVTKKKIANLSPCHIFTVLTLIHVDCMGLI